MTQEHDHNIRKTGLREVAWFVALWLLGVLAIALVGGVIKLVIGT